MSLQSLHGVGVALLKKLERAGIHTLMDLLLHLPKCYQDRRYIVPIATLVHGADAQIEATILQVKTHRNGRKKYLTLRVADDSGYATVMFFSYYPNILQTLEVGKKLRLYGQVKADNGVLFVHPEWQVIEADNPILHQGIVPIYPSIEGITSKTLHKLIIQAYKQTNMDELLPPSFRPRNMIFSQALAILHMVQPNDDSLQQVPLARERLAIEELLAHVLVSRKIKSQQMVGKAVVMGLDYQLHRDFLAQLPFTPTGAQDRVITEILADMRQVKPMARLLQGDVGSGKTLVATVAILNAISNGMQAVLMAPTEILAEQHYHNLHGWLSGFGFEVVFLANKCRAKEKREALATIASNPRTVIIGTHAVFQEAVQYCHLGLVVIDEQHRFGVEQRLQLLNKASAQSNIHPHQLVMSATPIPRTLAMAFYGDLDVSVIDELPPNRQAIQTSVMSGERQLELFARLGRYVAESGQAYWVCPFIESSEAMAHVQDVESLYAMMCEALPQCRIGLVHGKMKAQDKQAVMQAFKAHELDILVATTVIEVGVDVPNASIMVIDNAERMGLSQLHQLRGRVGRGSVKSYCILLYHGQLGRTAGQRLALMRDSQDGFYLANEDLRLRGSGDILGKNQTGEMQFKVASLFADNHHYQQISHCADQMLSDYPTQAQRLMDRWLQGNEQYTRA